VSGPEEVPANLSPVAAAMALDPGVALLDPRTGLPTARWMLPFLAGRVAVARRTLVPLTCAVLTVGPAPRVPLSAPGAAWVSALLVATFRESDTVGALPGDRFLVVLEDTTVAQATAALGRVADELHDTPASLWAGVASYPAHGLDGDELLAGAGLAHHLAIEEPQGRVLIAT
jgi:GGDEF domain-containing protein